MNTHPGHEIVKCSCGAVIRQCRCPHAKPTRVIPNGCPACQKKTEQAETGEDWPLPDDLARALCGLSNSGDFGQGIEAFNVAV